ncbi:hypothetical protein [Burkholderia ubonensis]|uniref:hypothetical protein n=1 Tax=Burkholderia ubonensis TaxID=101571 RepID=UPI002FC7E661
MLLFVLVLFEQIGWALLLSAAVTLFLGVAGYYGAKREILVSSPTTRAVMRARTKQAAERFSSLGAGATVMAIFVHATSVSLALYGHMLLDTMIKDAFSMFIALAFLPVYVCGGGAQTRGGAHRRARRAAQRCNRHDAEIRSERRGPCDRRPGPGRMVERIGAGIHGASVQAGHRRDRARALNPKKVRVDNDKSRR